MVSKLNICKTKTNEAVESGAVEPAVGIYKTIGLRVTKNGGRLINNDVWGCLGWGGWAGPTGLALCAGQSI